MNRSRPAASGPPLLPGEYKARLTTLRAELFAAQQAVRKAGAGPVIVILSGPETAGRSECLNLLNEWMDPRGIITRAWREPSDEERERPPFWRYWRSLPARGQIGLFFGAWYGLPLRHLVEKAITRKTFDTRLAEIVSVERALTDDGAIIVKCWLHVDRETQERRLRAFEADPLTRWRATKAQWRQLKNHRHLVEVAGRAMQSTDSIAAPWHWIEAAETDHRNLRVGTVVRDALLESLAVPARRRPARPVSTASGSAASRDRPDALGGVDLAASLARKAYRRDLESAQGRLNRAQYKARMHGVSTVAVFEGWDAAGKGGAIRRVAAALDARDYRIISIAAPSDEELAHHYLWRFWRHLSRAGHVTVFDRSWYGRVLVERVERFARPDEWQRAYDEINMFEDQLVDRGIVVVKFWLHISKDEQLRRFRERQKTPHKQWKITDEDWRNRRRWSRYVEAVNEMVARTSTRAAPWVVVPANDKLHARVAVVKTLAEHIGRAVKRASATGD